MLKQLYDSIEQVLSNQEISIGQLRLLRDILKEFLSKEEFRLDCVEAVLSSLENSQTLNEQWIAPHLYYHEQLKYSVRIIFWPAFYDNNPHKHKTWSITGVLDNNLNINTYQMLEDNKRLKKERQIAALSGEAGYLSPGCIHSVSNPTEELSATIHIFNNIDASNPEENAVWYPSPRKYNLTKGLVERALTSCINIISKTNNDRSFDILKRIYTQQPLITKLLSIRHMYLYDSELAKMHYEKMEPLFI